MNETNLLLSAEQVDRFNRDGFLVVPRMVTGQRLETLKRLAQHALEHPLEPLELEVNLGYPGAPESRYKDGADTIRRQQGACQRFAEWSAWATDTQVKAYLQQLFAAKSIYLSQAHHNCLMTKSPAYSSDTGWHQDIRYWSFEKPELINVWLPLGSEQPKNGGLLVIPGSHKLCYRREQFDEKCFFKDDMEANQTLIDQAEAVELDAGDVLFFDCKLLHRASRNYTSQTKLSLVFTYHAEDNHPITGTRSAQQPEILLD